jgi:hypothetical protein
MKIKVNKIKCNIQALDRGQYWYYPEHTGKKILK